MALNIRYLRIHVLFISIHSKPKQHFVFSVLKLMFSFIDIYVETNHLYICLNVRGKKHKNPTEMIELNELKNICITAFVVVLKAYFV